MAKSVVKEIIIALLLCLAIILVLGILLYEYAPMSKTIPNPVLTRDLKRFKRNWLQVIILMKAR